MSGCSDIGTCPKCGGQMETYTDYKPHDTVSGECLECGFEYWTEEGQRTLEQVNELRVERDMKQLKKLRKQVDP